jgi:hypothetical protein
VVGEDAKLAVIVPAPLTVAVVDALVEEANVMEDAEDHEENA